MMSTSPMTDEQAAARFLDGDERTLPILYERWKHGLYRFCFRLIDDSSIAEDIVHDAFAKLLTQRGTIHNASALKSWMFSVVRNAALTNIKQQRRYRPLAEGDDNLFWESSAVEVVENAERVDIIATALRRLLPQYTEVLMLREYESMTYEEIAAITETTVSSVKSRLFKARKALMSILETERNGETL